MAYLSDASQENIAFLTTKYEKMAKGATRSK